MSDGVLAPRLREGAAALGLALSDRQIQQLLGYLALLEKWNRVYNLTAVRDRPSMLAQHLLDSLAVIGPLQRTLEDRGHGDARVLDVGSGGGLPGVVIAIACPRLQVTCLDAVAKKTAFVRQAGLELGLARLDVRHARVETVTDARFDIVCSRAFASLADFVHWTTGLLAPGGCWMALKGQVPVDELAALPSQARVFHVEPLAVPGLDARRCIVWMEAAAPEASAEE